MNRAQYLLSILLVFLPAIACDRSSRFGEVDSDDAMLRDPFDCSVEDLISMLDRTIEAKEKFVERKRCTIDSMVALIDTTQTEPSLSISRMLAVSDEYAKFNVDSAIFYASLAEAIAHSHHLTDNAIEASLRKSRLLSTCGRFREAEAILLGIDRDNLPDYLVSDYFGAYTLFWDAYTISVPHHEPYPVQYRDSLMMSISRNSYTYRVNRAADMAITDSAGCRDAFDALMADVSPLSAEYAMLTNHYGSICRDWGLTDRARRLFAVSAVADIYNATRETLSLQYLAKILYDEGDVTEALRYTRSALDDVIESGISLRAPEVYNLFSIITDAYNVQERSRKHNLIIFTVAIGIALLIVVVLAIFSLRQVKRVTDIKTQLVATNGHLSRLNDVLTEKNDQLIESNNIKEQYIAQFFDLCFCFIGKMEQTRKSLYVLVCTKAYDQLSARLKPEGSVSEELKELYKRFDSVFLTLYPTFVDDINAMLHDGQKITLRQPGMLNRELRIFALMRLGISDSGKIAEFLHCSVSTVYNYRTRLRNKAIDRDRFEDYVMKISYAAPGK